MAVMRMITITMAEEKIILRGMNQVTNY